jgi:hypothetical protein
MKHIFFLLIIGSLLVSCRKKEDTVVQITVKNAQNENVEGATVKLLTLPPHESNATPILEMEGTTNAEGVVNFNFNNVYQLGQAGVAVLNIEVKKGDLEGSGIIKVEQETVSKEVVFI